MTSNSNNHPKATIKMEALEQKLRNHEKDIQSSLKKLKIEIDELNERKTELLDRQEALLEKNCGTDVAPSDMITLNVSGTEMFARRDTLTAIQGSRLEALFSGRWENKLLRDSFGRVFLEVDPVAFRKILEYLYLAKLPNKKGNTKGNVQPLILSFDSSADKESFDDSFDFFRLRRDTKAVTFNPATDKADSADAGIKNIIQNEKAIIEKMKIELDSMEKAVEAEEQFVEHFIEQGSVWTSCHTKVPSSGISVDSEDYSSMSSFNSARLISPNVFDEDLGILNLLVCGEMLVAKQSTLCLDPKSRLTENFTSDKWLKDHLVVTEDGVRCFVVEQPLAAFHALLRQLNRKAINKAEGCASTITFKHKNDSEAFSRMYDYYFPSGTNIISFEAYRLDSSIIVDPLHEAKIKEWLKSAKRPSFEPKLLYRASRDGWNASDFHRTCDGITNTLTVIKSTAGYIFGGYSDLSWSSSTGKLSSESDAFLFHINSYAGLAPGMLGNTGYCSNGYNYYAIQPSTSYGPRFGYNTYGGHYDLKVESCPNRQNSTVNNNLGNSSYSCYELPSGRASTFLVGGSSFLTSELEVFEV